MKLKDIDTTNPYNAALVDCLRILNAASKSGAHSISLGDSYHYLIEDYKLQPVKNKIQNLIKP